MKDMIGKGFPTKAMACALSLSLVLCFSVPAPANAEYPVSGDPDIQVAVSVYPGQPLSSVTHVVAKINGAEVPGTLQWWTPDAVPMEVTAIAGEPGVAPPPIKYWATFVPNDSAYPSKVLPVPVTISSTKLISSDDVFATAAAATYIGAAIEPVLSVSLGGSELKKGVDFKVVPHDAFVNAGNYQIAIEGLGKYSGEREVAFTIAPASIDNAVVKLSASSVRYTGKRIKPVPEVVLSLNGRDVALNNGTDFAVQYGANKHIGKARNQVKVTGEGNFTGSVTKSFAIVPAGTYVKHLKAESHGFKVYLKKQKAGHPSGYLVRYSTHKSMKDAKVKRIKGDSHVVKTVSKLRGKKTYYVQVAVYKGKYVSGWSHTKHVKTFA